MQRTISLAASSSSSPSALSLRPLMAKLQCRTLQNLPVACSSPFVTIDSVCRHVSQVQFKKGTIQSICTLPSRVRLFGSLSCAAPWNSSCSWSLGSSSVPFLVNNSLFTRRCFSQVPNVGNKSNNVGGCGGGDGKSGVNRSTSKKFRKRSTKHKAMASTKAGTVSTEPAVGGGSTDGIKVELSTEASSASNNKQASTAKTKRRSKNKKSENKPSSAAPVSELVFVEESSKGVHKSKSSRKSSSASKKEATTTSIAEEPDGSVPSKSKFDEKHVSNDKPPRKPTKRINGSQLNQSPQTMKNSIEHRCQNALNPLYPPRGKSVIVVESVTKAKIIQGYLGNMYEVLPSYGHIRDLAQRSGSVRPDKDFSMVWEVPAPAWTHLKCIKVALNGAENLILASDPDREGEAISWHIIEMLQQQDALHESMTVARVVFHEITESAIKNALQAPREIDANLVDAYLARRALDYLIGFSISPVLWRKLPSCRSAGRVQSAALALICDRESDIDEFKPQEYWTVGIKLQEEEKSTAFFSAHLTCLNSTKLNQLSISSNKEAEDIEQRIRSENFQVIHSKRSTMRKNPPTPYITSTLQQDAANKLHFSTTYTMMVAQKLYEGVQLNDGKAAGLITYIRTDGLHISDEAVKGIQNLVAERYGQNYASKSPRKYFRKVKNAQEAHEAIRPTDIWRLPSMLVGILDEDSLKLYTLIWSRTMACQMEPASIGQIQLDIGNASETIVFRSSCSKVEFLGYQAVYEDTEAKAIKYKDDDVSEREETFGILSELKAGDQLFIGDVELKQHYTQHPPRYSEGSLIKKLEELGIGRPSTYASIFKVLQERDYVTLKSRILYPEFRGRMVSAFLTNYFTEVTDYSFTADMETELDNVSAGLTEWKGLVRDYWTRFSSYCKRAHNVPFNQVEKMLEKRYGDFLFASLPGGSRTCPSCMEGTLSFKVSKHGAGYFIGCDQHPRCKYIAKTLYGENEDEDDPPKIVSVEEPKLLGLHPNSNEKVLLKNGPYGYYVQLGEDRTGYLPKRASASHIKDVDSITLEDAFELLRYPLTLGNHPKDGQPVLLKLAKFGFTVRHRRTMATVPKSVKPGDVTLEKALKLLSSNNVRRSGRPKKTKPKVDEEEGEEEAVEAM